MHPLWKKLNCPEKTGLLVVNFPDAFQSVLADLPTGCQAECTDIRVRSPKTFSTTFCLFFVMESADVEAAASLATAHMQGDAVVWIANPKKTSKKYACQLHRDCGWEPLARIGLEPVRQVAIDEDWSTLRFRRVEFIKNFTRSVEMAQTALGKQRAMEAYDSAPTADKPIELKRTDAKKTGGLQKGQPPA